MFATAILESIYSNAVNHNIRANVIARPKRTHYNDMNDRIFDIDMNVYGILQEMEESRIHSSYSMNIGI
jgi:hypothetical protein